jgi:hypothetical protein
MLPPVQNHKHNTSLERPATDKHSSLVGLSVIFKDKTIVNAAPVVFFILCLNFNIKNKPFLAMTCSSIALQWPLTQLNLQLLLVLWAVEQSIY